MAHGARQRTTPSTSVEGACMPLVIYMNQVGKTLQTSNQTIALSKPDLKLFVINAAILAKIINRQATQTQMPEVYGNRQATQTQMPEVYGCAISYSVRSCGHEDIDLKEAFYYDDKIDNNKEKY
ncbi:MAG: hypothetical protein OEY79_01960, partial [Anaplasmataceae bacterium]|nr:hypothetical protein [Anaplasmataceae bacterium]